VVCICTHAARATRLENERAHHKVVPELIVTKGELRKQETIFDVRILITLSIQKIRTVDNSPSIHVIHAYTYTFEHDSISLMAY
jgi:hypothetical protein